MVVSKPNLNDLEDTAHYVKSLGLTSFSATKATTPPNCPDFSRYSLSSEELKIMFDKLLSIKRDEGLLIDSLEPYPLCHFQDFQQIESFGHRSCGAGKTICTIGFDGAIRPCSHADQKIGKILGHNSFQELWLRLQPWRTNEYIPEGCNECGIKNVCYGGCRIEAYVVNGSLKSENPYCNLENIPHSDPFVLSRRYEDRKFNPEGIFKFKQRLKDRWEDFGGIIYLSSKAWVGVSEDILAFYKRKGSDSFAAVDLSNAMGVDRRSIEGTMEMFYKKNIIEEGR